MHTLDYEYSLTLTDQILKLSTFIMEQIPMDSIITFLGAIRDDILKFLHKLSVELIVGVIEYEILQCMGVYKYL